MRSFVTSIDYDSNHFSFGLNKDAFKGAKITAKNDSGLGVWAIVAIVFGAILLIAIIIGVILYIRGRGEPTL